MAVLVALLGIALAGSLGLGSPPEVSVAVPVEGEAVAAADSVTPSVGRFRFAGGKSQRESVTAAVERAVQSLLPVFHELARKRLTKANRVPDAINFAMEGSDFVIRYGDLEPMRAPLDGSVRTWHNHEGTKLKLKYQRRGDNRIVQTTWGGGGRRVMVWSFNDDGSRVRLHSTMSSPSLPEDVVYRLTFRK